MINFQSNINFLYFINETPTFFKFFGGIVITLVIGTFLYIIIKGISTWSSNNAADIIQKKCRVIDKRTEVWGGAGDSSASTNYYITFEFEDHSRLELPVKDKYFGLISVGDIGELNYQGTRFNEFRRTIDQKM